jgi:hypothetical protein
VCIDASKAVRIVCPLEESVRLTEIAAVIKTVGTASIADSLFTLLELFQEPEVAWDC